MNKKSVESANTDSILWADLYKFTMMWAVIKNFPQAIVKYQFFDRNNTVYPEGFSYELRKIVDKYRNKTISPVRKKEFMAASPFLPAAFFDFIEGYRYDPSEVGIMQEGGKLKIEISGYWYRTILWETTLMEDICELYYKMTGLDDNSCKDNIELAIEKTAEKSKEFHFNNIQVADFGTRRAKSKNHHENVVKTLSDSLLYKGLVGSSNVELALAYGIKPIGTYAHEWVSGIAAMFGYSHANKYAMEYWVSTYNGNLGIALTDTFTTDAFLEDFDSKYANLFTGVRHDSGDPFEFTDKIIDHYKKLGIDPTTKTIVYSDALTTELAVKISKYRSGEIRKSFGIGTHLTNDIAGVKPMNIVIKLVQINGMPTIKLSDSPTKHIGDEETIKFVKWQIDSKLKNNKNV